MQLIDLAQTGARPIDPMLHLRRDYFSGEAYKFRGYLHRVEQRFDLAEADARKARETYDAYMKHGALELNDRILSELAHASNNLAFALANNGHLEKALNVSNDLLSPKKNLMRYLSDYHKALLYNTNALIFMFRAEYLRAEEPIRQAEQAAQSSGNNRAKGLVRWARAHLERSKMEEQRKIDITINQLFQQAADLLAEEPDQLIHLYHDWAGYERDIYLRAREIADESDDHMDAATYAQNALQRLHKAQHLLEQADDKGISNMMRQADLLESMATLHNLMGNYAAAREYVGRAEAIIQAIPGSVYVQVVCAKIALQSAVATLYDHPDSQQYQDALRLMAIALARVYIFARRHRDQQIIERVIKDLLDDTPPDELRAFLQRLKKHAFSVPAEALGYQIPDATQWAIVMGAGLRFLQESINVCLGDY
jgi:tetratricopeptide (TPR) repeat protein